MPGKWYKIISVPDKKAATTTAIRWRKRADKVKVIEEDGWYTVYALNPSEGARIIFNL